MCLSEACRVQELGYVMLLSINVISGGVNEVFVLLGYCAALMVS